MVRKPAQKNEIQFEKSLKRLEDIVGTLENGEVPLTEAVKLYEEGITLSKACLKQLNDVELKLKKITAELDGSFRTEDLHE
jgi:exodeoxyribonuclease VII small subunit